MSKLKKKIVSRHDMNNIDPSNIYDPSNRPLKFQNISKLLDELVVIFEYMNKDEVKELKNNVEEYGQHLRSKFKNFAMNNSSIFKLIIEGKDISFFFKMLRLADKLDNKKMKKKKKDKLARKMIGKLIKKEIIDPQLNKINN